MTSLIRIQHTVNQQKIRTMSLVLFMVRLREDNSMYGCANIEFKHVRSQLNSHALCINCCLSTFCSAVLLSAIYLYNPTIPCCLRVEVKVRNIERFSNPLPACIFVFKVSNGCPTITLLVPYSTPTGK